MTLPQVSIVVCTYNRAASLRRALASLAALETEGRVEYEILVVDNASSDNTTAAIAECAAELPANIRSVYEPQGGVAYARNCGVREARGEWIAFFDDDQEADPRWLIELISLAQSKSARVVGGQSRLALSDDEVAELSHTCRLMLGQSYLSDKVCAYHRGWAPGTGNLMLHKSVFAEVGVFNEELREAGEDTELFARIRQANIPAWHTPLSFSYHEVPRYRLTERYFRWKSFRSGSQMARCDFSNRGRVTLVCQAIARFGQALLLHVPRLTWATLRGDRVSAQQWRCLLWRAEAYVRFAAHLLAPRLFPQKAFIAQLDFRGERTLLGEEEEKTKPAEILVSQHNGG